MISLVVDRILLGKFRIEPRTIESARLVPLIDKVPLTINVYLNPIMVTAFRRIISKWANYRP